MLSDGFPSYLKDDVTKVVKLLTNKIFFNFTIKTSQDTVQYFQNGHIISFPYRIYYDDKSNAVIKNLNDRQKMIMHCIYSRSSDGYIRQKHIRSLLEMDYEDWAIPYIVKICDEYVVEILEMTFDLLQEQDIERIKNFCSKNRIEFCKSYSRMISYWNEFYREKYSNFHQYIGRKLFRECFGYSRSMELEK
jgi:hypothetical protein